MMIRKWEQISSDIVYQKKWMKIREESCRLPDGQVLNPYIIVDVPNFCNVFVVTEMEEVIFVKQYRHAAGIISLELPGGMIDEGEDPIKSVAREMKEETGYVSEEIELLFTVYPNPPLESNIAWFYIAKNAKNIHSRSLDQFEDIEVIKISKNDFLRMLLNNEFTHGAQVGAMYAAAIKMQWLVMK